MSTTVTLWDKVEMFSIELWLYFTGGVATSCNQRLETIELRKQQVVQVCIL